MIAAYVLAAAVLVIFGAAAGFLAVISLGSGQAKDKDITAPTSSRLVRGVRVANGLHVRMEPLREAAAYRHDLPRPADREWW